MENGKLKVGRFEHNFARLASTMYYCSIRTHTCVGRLGETKTTKQKVSDKNIVL